MVQQKNAKNMVGGERPRENQPSEDHLPHQGFHLATSHASGQFNWSQAAWNDRTHQNLPDVETENRATRSVLSGRRSNRFHLDSNLSHRNDHVTMSQPPASIQGGGPRCCQLFQDQQLQGVPEPWKHQRCYSSTSAAETSSRIGSAWISPGLPPVVANSNARKCPSCIGNLQLAKFWPGPFRNTFRFATSWDLATWLLVTCGSLGSFAAKCLACAWWHASQGFLAGTTGTHARAKIERGRSIQKYRNSLVSEIVSKKSLMSEVEGCKRPSHDRNFLPQEFRSAVNNCKDKSLIPAKQKVRNWRHHQSDMQNIGWNQAIGYST